MCLSVVVMRVQKNKGYDHVVCRVVINVQPSHQYDTIQNMHQELLPGCSAHTYTLGGL